MLFMMMMMEVDTAELSEQCSLGDDDDDNYDDDADDHFYLATFSALQRCLNSVH